MKLCIEKESNICLRERIMHIFAAAEKQTQKLKNIRKNRNVAKQFDTLQHHSLSNVAVK